MVADDLGKHFEGRDVGQVLAFAHALRFDPGLPGGRPDWFWVTASEKLDCMSSPITSRLHLRTELLANHRQGPPCRV